MKKLIQPALAFSSSMFNRTVPSHLQSAQQMLVRATPVELRKWVADMKRPNSQLRLPQDEVTVLVAWSLRNKALGAQAREVLTGLPNFNIHAREPASGKTLLSLALQENDSEFVRHLLAEGADPDLVDPAQKAVLSLPQLGQLSASRTIRQLGLNMDKSLRRNMLEIALARHDVPEIRRYLERSMSVALNANNFLPVLEMAGNHNDLGKIHAMLVLAQPEWLTGMDQHDRGSVQDLRRMLAVLNRLHIQFPEGRGAHRMDRALARRDLPGMHRLLQEFFHAPLSADNILSHWKKALRAGRHDMLCAILAVAAEEHVDILHRAVDQHGVSLLHKVPDKPAYAGLKAYLKQYSHYTKNPAHDMFVNINGRARFFASVMNRPGVNAEELVMENSFVMCRSIALLRGMEHLRQIKAQRQRYIEAREENPEIANPVVAKEPFDYAKFSNAEQLSRHMPYVMDKAATMVRVLSREVHVDLDYRDWGRIVHGQFQEMAAMPWEDGLPREHAKVMLLTTPNHVLTVLLRVRADEEGNRIFKLKVSDPNVSIPAKRASAIELDKVLQWNFPSMLIAQSAAQAADAAASYFPEDAHEFTLARLPDELTSPKALLGLLSTDYMLGRLFGKETHKFPEEFRTFVSSLPENEVLEALRPTFVSRDLVPALLDDIKQFPPVEAHVRKFVRDIIALPVADMLKARMLIGDSWKNSILMSALDNRSQPVIDTIVAAMKSLKLTQPQLDELFCMKDEPDTSLLAQMASTHDGAMHDILAVLDGAGVSRATQERWLFENPAPGQPSMFADSATHGRPENFQAMLERFDALPLPERLTLLSNGEARHSLMYKALHSVNSRTTQALLDRIASLDIPDTEIAALLGTGPRSFYHQVMRFDNVELMESVGAVITGLVIGETEKLSLLLDAGHTRASPAKQTLFQTVLNYKGTNSYEMLCSQIGGLDLDDEKKTTCFFAPVPQTGRSAACHALSSGNEDVMEKLAASQALLGIADATMARILSARDDDGVAGIVLAQRGGFSLAVQRFRELAAPLSGQEAVRKVLAELDHEQQALAVQA